MTVTEAADTYMFITFGIPTLIVIWSGTVWIITYVIREIIRLWR